MAIRRRVTDLFSFLAFGFVAIGGVFLNAPAAAQQVYINEIFFNAPNPSRADASHQYIELRGDPNASLTNHFLIFIENEDNSDHLGNAGIIENIFDLGNAALGSNGFLVLRQKLDPSPAFADYSINPRATDLRNTGSGQGFGSGATSSIGAENINTGLDSGLLEASGFTAMLIRTDGQTANRPMLNFDVDQGNDGLDNPNGHDGWTIVDSIALFGEENEADFGRVYAPLAFGFEPSAPGIPAGGTYVYLEWPELEAEYIGRWDDSTGHAPGDWHVSNVTTNSQSGFQNKGDFRQASDPHNSNALADLESNLYVPYGTNITGTLGSSNYPINVGDFNANGQVNFADYPTWEAGFGSARDGNDFLIWQRSLGKSTVISAAAVSAPEPASASIAGAAAVVAAGAARRRYRDGNRRPASSS